LIEAMRKALSGLLALCAAQAAMTWLLYRSRAVMHSGWAESDFVVFGLPLLVGVGLSALFSWRTAWPKRSVTRFAIAVSCALFSALFGGTLGFNLYGT
jgi:hypothetical protein